MEAGQPRAAMAGPKPAATLDKSATAPPALKQTPSPKIHYPFWFGGSASSMAACVTHPLDLVKVRLQTRTGSMPTSMSGTFLHILKNVGPLGLYSGLSASLLRQLTYSTTRFGIYEDLKSRLPPSTTPHSLPTLILLSATSGFIGGIAGNPADVLNVRMQHDASLPPSQRRNYAHALDGLIRMAREEGLRSWFRGVGPNAARAAAMTSSQLASYDVVKRMLVGPTGLGMEDGPAAHFCASLAAGVVAATVTSPVDVIKTRVMSAAKGGQQGVGAMLGEVYRAEGLRWMFRGWLPSFLRLGPQTICTFLFLETHRDIYRKLRGLDN